MSDIIARFYQPIFGNDNVYAPDVIDLNAFFAPTLRAQPQKTDSGVSVPPRTAKN